MAPVQNASPRAVSTWRWAHPRFNRRRHLRRPKTRLRPAMYPPILRPRIRKSLPMMTRLAAIRV
eukprot:1548188-Pyramimonas_sp.AAC.2